MPVVDEARRWHGRPQHPSVMLDGRESGDRLGEDSHAREGESYERKRTNEERETDGESERYVEI